MTQWINCVTISNHNSNKTIIKKNKTIIVIGRIHGFSQRVYNSFVHAKSFDPNLSAGLRLWNWKKVFFFWTVVWLLVGTLGCVSKKLAKVKPKKSFEILKQVNNVSTITTFAHGEKERHASPGLRVVLIASFLS